MASQSPTTHLISPCDLTRFMLCIYNQFDITYTLNLSIVFQCVLLLLKVIKQDGPPPLPLGLHQEEAHVKL